MNKDVTQFIEQLHDISTELKQRSVESEALVLSKDEVDVFSKLLISTATVLTAADKAFVRQERISFIFAGLATVTFSLLIPVSWMLFSPLLSPSTRSAQVSRDPIAERVQFAKQLRNPRKYCAHNN